jgi:hypothetical protein
MKKLVCLVCSSCVALLLVSVLAGCSRPPAETVAQDDGENSAEQQDDALSQTAAQDEDEQGSDYTVKVPAYDIGAVRITSVSTTASGDSFPYPCQTVSELDAHAPVIIVGTIVGREFFPFDGNAYIKLDVVVSTSIKGKLVPGDTISVIQRGGYISIADIVTALDNGSRFADVPEAQWANTYLTEAITGQDFPVVGEKYAYFLQPGELVSGSYGPVNQYEGTFRMGTNWRYTRYNPSEGYVPVDAYTGDRYHSEGNSVIDSFTFYDLTYYFG